MRALKAFLAVVLILSSAIGVFLWLQATKPVVPAPALNEKAWPVAVQTVSLEILRPQRTVFASVSVPVMHRFQSPIAAWVEKLAVKPQQQVAQGELLYALNEVDIQAELAQARAQVADLEAQLQIEQLNLKAQQRLQERKLANDLAVAQLEAKLAQLQARLSQARARLQQVERALRRAKVFASQPLRIVDVKVGEGERVAPGQLLLSAYAPEALEYQITLPERIWQQVAPQAASLQLKDKLGRLYAFARVSQQRSPLGVQVWFDAPDTVQLGDLKKLTLLLPPREQVAAIPYSALYGEDTVYLVDSTSRLRRHSVRLEGTVQREGRAYALVSGLPDQSVVMTTHLPHAIDGLKVKALP